MDRKFDKKTTPCNTPNSKGDSTVGVKPPSVHNLHLFGDDAMTEQEPTKKCSKCQEIKPVSEFSKSKATKDGFVCHCKLCMKEYNRRYKELNLEKIIAKKREHYKKNSKQILSKNKIYSDSHKKERSLCAKRYRMEHGDEIRERERLSNKKRAKENPHKSKEYYKKHIEKNRARAREYQKANPHIREIYSKTENGRDILRKCCHNYRARKLNAKIEQFSPKEIFERDNYICQLCGCKTRPDYKNKYHPKYPNLDHIVPLTLGGDHSKANTQCLCHECNVKKSNTGKGDQLRLFG